MEGPILVLVVILALVIACIAFFCGQARGKNKAIQPTLIKNDILWAERKQLDKDIQDRKKQLSKTEYDIVFASNKVDDLEREIAKKHDYLKNYQYILEQTEKLKEEELQKQYDDKKFKLDEAYQEQQQQILTIQSELESLKNTRAAIIEAHKREEELSNNDFYVLQIPQDELDDIHYLERIKSKLNFPIVIGKVIWTTFIQKKVNALAARVLPQKVTIGIYKITNLNTNECYIGQSVDIRQRFIDHCKAGLGAVEASVSNKLYAAMRQDGIENFAFELLEECTREQLNEKEKYYIELYNADEVGYNSQKGNKN